MNCCTLEQAAMNRHTTAVLALATSLTLAPPARAADGDARAVAVKVTTAGAAMFSASDARGLAATYLDDARLDVISRDKDTGKITIESKLGRPEIEAYYEGLFKNGGVGQAKNNVEHARFIEPDLLLITGLFEPNTDSAEPMRLPFVQTRQKQGEFWRIVSLQVWIVLQK
jgi:hypothetical protein